MKIFFGNAPQRDRRKPNIIHIQRITKLTILSNKYVLCFRKDDLWTSNDVMFGCCYAMRLIWCRIKRRKEKPTTSTCCCKLLHVVKMFKRIRREEMDDCFGCGDRKRFEQNVNWLIHLFLLFEKWFFWVWVDRNKILTGFHESLSRAKENRICSRVCKAL